MLYSVYIFWISISKTDKMSDDGHRCFDSFLSRAKGESLFIRWVQVLQNYSCKLEMIKLVYDHAEKSKIQKQVREFSTLFWQYSRRQKKDKLFASVIHQNYFLIGSAFVGSSMFVQEQKIWSLNMPYQLVSQD